MKIQKRVGEGRSGFFTSDNVMILISREHCHRLHQSRCHAVIDE